MCELFGFTGRTPQKLNQELKEFYSHSGEHPNGWGLAILDEMNFSIEKEPVKASDSRYLKERLKEPIVCQTGLAHIRLATIGNMEWKNSHPFTATDQSKRRWTLIHNGTIFECKPMEKYVRLQKGDTDSERILLYLIDLINEETTAKGRALNPEERFAILDRMVATIAPENKLNLLIYDGELFYAHTNYVNSLYLRRTQEGIYFSTQPLALGIWEPVPFTTLLAYHQGQLAFTGTNHGQEYFVDERKMELLFLAYSEL